jgi:hypothetical protein
VKPSEESKKSLLEFATWAAQNRYTIHIHFTHNTNAGEILDVFEEVNRAHPITNLRWAISHVDNGDLPNSSEEGLRGLAAQFVLHSVFSACCLLLGTEDAMSVDDGSLPGIPVERPCEGIASA